MSELSAIEPYVSAAADVSPWVGDGFGVQTLFPVGVGTQMKVKI